MSKRLQQQVFSMGMRTGTQIFSKGMTIAKFGLNLFSSQHPKSESSDKDQGNNSAEEDK